MNLSISVVSPNPINYPSPSPFPQHTLPSPSPESQRAQTPPPPPPPESKISVSEFFLLSKEERNKFREKIVSEISKKMKEDQENGYEAPSDPEDHNPVPADYAWPDQPKIVDPDDWEDVPAWTDQPKIVDPDDWEDAPAWTDLPKIVDPDPDAWKDAPVIPHSPPFDPNCDICGRLHCMSCCPYWFEFPAGGVLRNTSDYLIVCECGEVSVDGRCPDARCHPNNIRYVVARPSSPQYSDCPSYEDSPARDSPTIVAYPYSFSAQGSVT